MINIKNLYFSYPNSPCYLLKDININIPKGSYVSIIGENGSCKSTLVKLILNLLKPLKGTIELKGSKVGYVPQRMDNFNAEFPITVKELLNTYRKLLKIKDSTAIYNCLKKVNMVNFENHLLGNLSGGQQQRIFIAKALMGTPDILILDEPSTGIDITNQREIYYLIKHLNLCEKITVISVEHNLDAVLSNSTHVLQLKDGGSKLYTLEEFKASIDTQGGL